MRIIDIVPDIYWILESLLYPFDSHFRGPSFEKMTQVSSYVWEELSFEWDNSINRLFGKGLDLFEKLDALNKIFDKARPIVNEVLDHLIREIDEDARIYKFSTKSFPHNPMHPASVILKNIHECLFNSANSYNIIMRSIRDDIDVQYEGLGIPTPVDSEEYRSAMLVAKQRAIIVVKYCRKLLEYFEVAINNHNEYQEEGFLFHEALYVWRVDKVVSRLETTCGRLVYPLWTRSVFHRRDYEYDEGIGNVGMIRTSCGTICNCNLKLINSVHQPVKGCDCIDCHKLSRKNNYVPGY
jgi:hypothetical protein